MQSEEIDRQNKEIARIRKGSSKGNRGNRRFTQQSVSDMHR